jgi:exportin-T
MTQLLPVMLRFLADPYDDTCSTVFPMLQVILSGVSLTFFRLTHSHDDLVLQYKRIRKISTGAIDETKRSFLTSLLQVILTKMKWDPDADPDDVDEDDNAEFEKMRKV